MPTPATPSPSATHPPQAKSEPLKPGLLRMMLHRRIVSLALRLESLNHFILSYFIGCLPAAHAKGSASRPDQQAEKGKEAVPNPPHNIKKERSSGNVNVK